MASTLHYGKEHLLDGKRKFVLARYIVPIDIVIEAGKNTYMDHNLPEAVILPCPILACAKTWTISLDHSILSSETMVCFCCCDSLSTTSCSMDDGGGLIIP